MIYTVGHTETYREAQAECAKKHEPFEKLGRNGSYDGGTVFSTVADAAEYLAAKNLPTYSIWEVDGNWELDTAAAASGVGRALLKDAAILREVI